MIRTNRAIPVAKVRANDVVAFSRSFLKQQRKIEFQITEVISIRFQITGILQPEVQAILRTDCSSTAILRRSQREYDLLFNCFQNTRYGFACMTQIDFR